MRRPGRTWLSERLTAGMALGGGWLAGTAVGVAVVPSETAVGMAAAALVPGALLVTVLVRPALVGLAVLGLLGGLARAEVPPSDPALLERATAATGAAVSVRGTVDEDPRPAGSGWEAVVDSGPRGLGRVLLSARGGLSPAAGDEVEAEGRLRLPREQPGFDRRAYLRAQGVAVELVVSRLSVLTAGPGWRALPQRVREACRSALRTLLPEPAAALELGILLGVRDPLPPALRQDLQASGLLHLLVLSGLKVAIFTRFAAAVLTPLPRLPSLVALLALVAFYALTGGATAAGVRAAAMGGLVVFGTRLGRPTHVWTSLALAGAGMVAWRPAWIADTGFLMSFLGTAGIVLLTPPVERRLHRVPAPFREPLAVTAAAQVATLPVTAGAFHLFSPVAPLANAVALPLLPFLIGGGFLLLPLAWWPDLGRTAALALYFPLLFVARAAQLLGELPGTALPVAAVSLPGALAYYAGLGGGLAAWTAGRRRTAAALAALLPALVGLGALAAWEAGPPVATVLAVGNGQAVLVHGPRGALLVDAGPSPALLAAGVGSRLPPWSRRLEAVLLTAGGPAHSAGLAGVDAQVGRVLLPSPSPPGSAWRTAVAALVVRGARVQALPAGTTVGVAGVVVEALSPEPGDDGADPLAPPVLAVRISRPGGRALCDLSDLADPVAQAAAAARLGGDCDYVLLPGTGAGLPAPELLARCAKAEFVISAAAGRPAAGLAPGRVHRTDQEGDVDLPL